MPPDPSAKSSKRSLTPRRGAIACVRCKERKAKCTPAPPGASRLPTCLNCLNARASCVYLDRTPNEIFLLEYVGQLEARTAQLEMELSKYNPTSSFTSDHSSSQEAMTAAVDALTQQYSQGAYTASDGSPQEHKLGEGSNSQEGTSRQRQPSDDNDDELAMGVGMLSLSGLGDPLYLGASSGVNWARVCATALRRPNNLSSSSQGRFSFQAPPESASPESALSYGVENPIPPLPSAQLADQYFDLVYSHVQAQYGFLDWHALRSWHQNREQICLNRPVVGSGQGSDHARGLAAFLLWLVYGYGARLMEERKIEGAVSHEIYYSAAVACLSTLTSHHSLATVQCLLLLETYSIWHARSEISTWQVAGLALRTAIELGLHRRTRSRSEREKDPLRYEMKKRVFWTVYTMDRMLALQLGRPSGIADKDIDIEFPLNIDHDVTDPKLIFEMQNRQIEITRDMLPGEEYARGYDQVNSMTSSIHNVRLNQLKQLIQDTIYRLDKPLRDPAKGNDKFNGAQPIPEVEAVLNKLAEWRACRPVQPPGPVLPLLSREQLEMDYHECVQMLLRPIIASRKTATYYAPLCAESAASCCETDMFGPNSPSLRLVTWQLYRLFLSGLTLLHLVSSPVTQTAINHDRAASALHRSQQTVGQLVNIFPGASQYQHVFADLIRGWESRRHEQMSRMAASRPDMSRSASGSGSGHQLNGSGNINIKKSPSPGLGSLPNVALGESHLSWRQTMMTGQANPAPLDQNWMSTLATGMFAQPTMANMGGQSVPPHTQNMGSGHPNGQQTLTEDMGGSWTPLFGSPRSTEAFSDQWGGTLNQMGGQLAGPMRDDFFSLLSSFGLETIVESSNEASLPLTDGPIWQPPGLDALMLGIQQPITPTQLQPHETNMPDFTNMGMGEFLDWSQRTGRTGHQDQFQTPQQQSNSMFTSHDHDNSHSAQQDEQRGRSWHGH